MFGIRVICSWYALQDGNVRQFPQSMNRSRRIHKKLVKRFGGEFKKVPAIYRMGDTLVAHPDLFHLIKQEIASARVTDKIIPSGLPPEVRSGRVSSLGRYTERAQPVYSPVALDLDTV